MTQARTRMGKEDVYVARGTFEFDKLAECVQVQGDYLNWLWAFTSSNPPPS